MATIFILLVLAYYVIRFDVSIMEKIMLTTLVSAFALAPVALGNVSSVMPIIAAIGQGVIGIYIVLRMHYLRAAR